ncbi:hypothetical protein DFH06DRAFT_608683 [Mycena polygramma]|nr:hypothetical protein DFH06DRAFT_608683 [Mycena polygramma]
MRHRSAHLWPFRRPCACALSLTCTHVTPAFVKSRTSPSGPTAAHTSRETDRTRIPGSISSFITTTRTHLSGRHLHLRLHPRTLGGVVDDYMEGDDDTEVEDGDGDGGPGWGHDAGLGLCPVPRHSTGPSWSCLGHRHDRNPRARNPALAAAPRATSGAASGLWLDESVKTRYAPSEGLTQTRTRAPASTMYGYGNAQGNASSSVVCMYRI